MNNKIGLVLAMIGLVLILILLKPTAVIMFCQHRFEDFNQKQIEYYGSLPEDQKPSESKITTDYEAAYQAVYVYCIRGLGETP
jgi:hypothetical protein